MHVDEILFTDHRLDHETQVFGNRVAKGFTHQLTRVLDGELDFTLPVPLAAGPELALADPLGIVLNDAFDFEVGLELEFFQSEPDCKEFVPSLGIEPDLAAEVLHGIFLYFDDVFPSLVVTQKHAVVLGCPAFGSVGPVGARQV